MYIITRTVQPHTYMVRLSATDSWGCSLSCWQLGTVTFLHSPVYSNPSQAKHVAIDNYASFRRFKKVYNNVHLKFHLEFGSFCVCISCQQSLIAGVDVLKECSCVPKLHHLQQRIVDEYVLTLLNNVNQHNNNYITIVAYTDL